MKKCLIKGVLTLFAGAFVLSCSEKESEYVPLNEQKLETFERVFKEAYGEPAPDHDWGFTTKMTLADESTTEVIYVDSIVPVSVAKTRSTGVARTRTANPNANLWGRYYSNIPDPLTPAQKKRVRLYFQYNQYPTNEQVSYKNFFVQDVYKGATNALWRDEDGYRNYSKEMYPFGGTLEAGSNHMDKLTAGYSHDHIYNYNGATCSTNYSVWDGRSYDAGYPKDETTGTGDWEAENYNHIVFHQDEIMLMENSSTACFGWNESNGSNQHDENYVIISGATIDAWANSHSELGDLGASVSGRGFVGFDYDANTTANNVFQDPNGWDEYVWNEEKGENDIIHHDGPRTNADGVPYITSGTYDNQGSVTVVPAGTPGAYPVWERYVGGDQANGNVWVKLGCADGYYSDWIVCIVEAQGKTLTWRIVRDPVLTRTRVPVPDQTGRIFCEDLGVSNREDLDFNDVVFDVNVYKNFEEGWVYLTKVWSDGTKEDAGKEWYSTAEEGTYSAEITLQAAGGTLPLTVAGQEVHSKFGVGITTMVNTRDENSTAYGAHVTGYSPVYLGEFTTSQLNPNKADTDYLFASDVPIVVQYSTTINELASQLGGAPAKLFVPNQTTKWTVERKPLSLAYPDFYDYVTDKSVKWWEGPSDAAELERANYYRYNRVSYQNTVTPPIVVTRIHYPSTSQDVIWQGPLTYTSWTLNNIQLNFGKYYPGDYITFYVDNLTNDSYITVVFEDLSKPYFIDTVIRNYDVDANGNQVPKTSGVVEVMLDEQAAAKLSKKYETEGTLPSIQVQGKNFTLTSIGRTLFQ